jgi:uncharacterized surface protein with fasciclin (FAS1) repeats
MHGDALPTLAGSVFVNPTAALTYYRRRFSTLSAAIMKAGLMNVLTSPGFSGTILAPSNRAFEAAPNAMSMPASQLRDVLQYHVLPNKARTIPQGFTSGRSYVTALKGQTVKYCLAT